MHKFILKELRFKFSPQNSNLAKQCKSMLGKNVEKYKVEKKSKTNGRQNNKLKDQKVEK
jgi:hypothetical protein